MRPPQTYEECEERLSDPEVGDRSLDWASLFSHHPSFPGSGLAFVGEILSLNQLEILFDSGYDPVTLDDAAHLNLVRPEDFESVSVGQPVVRRFNSFDDWANVGLRKFGRRLVIPKEAVRWISFSVLPMDLKPAPAKRWVHFEGTTRERVFYWPSEEAWMKQHRLLVWVTAQLHVARSRSPAGYVSCHGM